MANYRSPSFQTEKDKKKQFAYPAPSIKGTFAGDLARRGAEVGSSIRNAPSVGAGLGQLARTVGQGYNALAENVVGPLISGAGDALVETGRHFNAGLEGEPIPPPIVGGAEIPTPKVAGAQGGNPVETPIPQRQTSFTNADAPNVSAQSGIDFSVSPETMNALKTRNSIAKARAYQALPENQRGRMPDDVARVLGGEPAPPIQNDVVLGQQYADETAARNARVDAQANAFRTRVKAKNAAASAPRRYRGQVYSNVLKTLTPEGPRASDVLGAARLSQTQQQNAIENDLAVRGLGLEEQKIQDRRAQTGASALQEELNQEYRNRKEQRKSASAQQEQVAQNYELGQKWQQSVRIPEGLDLDIGNQLSQQAWQMSGGDPGRASEILDAMFNEISGKTSGDFVGFDPRNTRSVIESIQKRLPQ